MKKVILTGRKSDFNKVQMSKLLRDKKKISLSDAKKFVDSILNNETVPIGIEQDELAEYILNEALELGVLGEIKENMHMKIYGLFFKRDEMPHTLLCEKYDHASSVIVSFFSEEDATKYKNKMSTAHQAMFVIKEITSEDFIGTKKIKQNDLGKDHRLLFEFKD